MDYIQVLAFMLFGGISFLCTMYCSNEKIKESVNGRKFLDSTELMVMKTLFSRADSTINTDLKNAGVLFKKLTLGLIALSFISEKLSFTISSYFFLIGGISLLFWAALSWGEDPFKETIDYLKHFLVLAAGIIGLCCLMPEIPPIAFISENIKLLEITDSSLGLKLITCLTLILSFLIIYILSCIVWTFVNSIFVGVFLMLSRLTAKLSNVIINNKKGFSFYIVIIGFISSLIAGSLFDIKWIL